MENFLTKNNVGGYAKIPLGKVAALGPEFGSIVSAFQKTIATAPVSHGEGVLYRLDIPLGGHLAQAKDGSGYLGSVLSNRTNKIMGQARLIPVEPGTPAAGVLSASPTSSPVSPVTFNPTMLLVAAALISIDQKLDSIQKMQQEILDFLVQKDKAELRGDIQFLTDVWENYKYNWDNALYKNSNHVKVLDIKQRAEQSIIFWKEKIYEKGRKRSVVMNNQAIKKHLDEMKSAFEFYQMAIYLYAFSSFVDVALLENFDEAFLDGVIKKIDDYSFEYQGMYSKCYRQLEDGANSSVEAKFLKAISAASSSAGKVIEKAPLIGKLQIDETLIGAGAKLQHKRDEQASKIMQDLANKQDDCVYPFIENIRTIKKLHSKPLDILFDQENLYIEGLEQ